MANAIKWEAAWSSAGNVITTEMNSLANGSWANGTTDYANQTNLNQYGKLEINLASLSPTAGAYLTLVARCAPDGTNYGDAPGANNPATHEIIAVIAVDTTASGAKRIMTPVFLIEPGITRFSIKNGCGVALNASGNTVELFVTNDEIQ